MKIFNYYGIAETAVADKLTYGSNVKEVTSQVSETAADCGIIYATDALSAGLTVVDSATAEMRSGHLSAVFRGDKEERRARLPRLSPDRCRYDRIRQSVGSVSPRDLKTHLGRGVSLAPPLPEVTRIGFPLWNSLRIAAISTVIIFFAGIFAAYYIAKLPRLIKGVLDVVLTLPLVLPPTVVGYLLLRVLGPRRVIGAWVLETFGVKLVMTWWSAIFATTVVIFPLMYRTVRGAFEAFDETLAYSGQTLGLSNTYIFWRIRMPCCRQGVLAGTVLAFARALGEYGATSMIAGYTPGKTATISTTVYQLWQTNNDALA